MRRVLLGIALAIALVGVASPAQAISAYPMKPTPCSAYLNGRPVYDHLRYWVANGWEPWSENIWRRTDSGLVCWIR